MKITKTSMKTNIVRKSTDSNNNNNKEVNIILSIMEENSSSSNNVVVVVVDDDDGDDDNDDDDYENDRMTSDTTTATHVEDDNPNNNKSSETGTLETTTIIPTPIQQEQQKNVLSAATTRRRNGMSGKQQQQQHSSSNWRNWIWYLLLHVFTMIIYMYPIYITSRSSNHGSRIEEATLDELHIVSNDNRDINGYSTTIQTIFTNDYWGRPMTSPSSHKSWRPMTVLSFRYLRGLTISIPDRILRTTTATSATSATSTIQISDLSMHRFVNIITHAAASDLIGKLAVKLLSGSITSVSSTSLLFTETRTWIFVIAKLCFALHPTHVEVTANAANRSHIIAVLLMVYACDPNISIIYFILSIITALLSSETTLFQIIPVTITMIAIAYVQQYHTTTIMNGQATRKRPNGNIIWQVLCIIFNPSILLRILWLGILAVSYYGGRFYFNTLSIPDGLIRPAENPFYPLTGWTRIYSYAMVIGIHIAKQYDLDYIGFSHEYGFNCVEPITHWYNIRLLPIVLIGIVHVFIGIVLLVQHVRYRRTISKGLILYVVTLSWTITLFPISGIVKVGTFISDRIVVPASVPVAILQAYAIVSWLQLSLAARRSHNSSSKNNNTISFTEALQNKYVRRKLYLLSILLILSCRRIHKRSLEWMSSISLLGSSLETCPRFAKGHLEISKIYSGLYPEKLNITQAQYHLQLAEKIDPNYCDVHFQFALLEARKQNYLIFEERLVQALQCGFTMGQAQPLWQQYWPNAFDEKYNTPQMIVNAKVRYNKYMSIISDAIAKEEEMAMKMEKQHQSNKKSPLTI